VEVMTAVSLLSSDSVFLQPYRDEEKKKAGLAHRRFASREGDLLTLITIYEAWTKVCSGEHNFRPWIFTVTLQHDLDNRHHLHLKLNFHACFELKPTLCWCICRHVSTDHIFCIDSSSYSHHFLHSPCAAITPG
jgi:hypothetical protein